MNDTLKITRLKLLNWKCFDNLDVKFQRRNIINRPNGTGKSSIFQAIIFGLFGKVPPGFNLNSLRKDPTKSCKVLVEFYYKNDTYEAYRQFGGNSYVVVRKNGNVVCTSSKESFNYINQILPYNIMSVLWAPNTLSTSNILKPAFLVDHLLDYIFEDPKFLLNHYKYELFGQNKVVKSIENSLVDLKIEDLDEAIKKKELEIEELKKKLKQRSNFNDSEANRASVAKEAYEKLRLENWDDVISKELLDKYRSIVMSNDPDEVLKNLKERLKKEESKEDSPLLKVQIASLRKIKEYSDEHCECLICQEKWSELKSERIQKVIDNPESKNPTLIESLKEKIEVLKLDSALVKKSLEYYRLVESVNACPEWEKILKEYDKENNKLWNQLEELQKELNDLKKQEDVRENYTKEKEKASQLAKRVNIISSYIKEASAYYSRTITEEASKILNKLNSRYEQVFLDENQYKVVVMNDKMTSVDLLPAVQLSSGERTLVGVSLILSAHKLFFPYAPLLFDESFAALDKENIMELKKLFKNNGYQTFIITHDNTWSEEVHS